MVREHNVELTATFRPLPHPQNLVNRFSVLEECIIKVWVSCLVSYEEAAKRAKFFNFLGRW